MSNILTHETLVDDTINGLCKRIDAEFVHKEKTCKMDEWLLFFVWDVIAQLTLSRPMGFMDEGKDHLGLLSAVEKGQEYFATVGQIPSLDQWLAKNPIRPIGSPSFDFPVVFCAEKTMERQQTGDRASARTDMLDWFLEIKRSNPEMMDDNAIIGAPLVKILGGADTTAILLRSIIYVTLKNPKAYKKLRAKLDETDLPQRITYAAASALP